LRDRVNLAVMAYYLVICVCGVWTVASRSSRLRAAAAIVAMMTATTVGLVLMAPYFGYVFWFLEPMNIIAASARTRCHRRQRDRASARRAASDALQARRLAAMEELTDITSNSISGKDKIIASAAVDALKDFVPRLPRPQGLGAGAQPWFADRADHPRQPRLRRDGSRVARATSRRAGPGSSGR
jgi:hypothetical protein